MYVHDDDTPHLGGNIASGDSWTYCPSVWQYCIDRFAIISVLDLGSGSGYSSHWFNRHGLNVIAVDGLETNIRTSRYPAIQHDITISAVVAPVDLVHCHEVVEHIEEKYLDNLLTSLLNGRIIIMTNAVPGQAGHHHVNLQPTEYWIDHLTQRGCQLLSEDTARIRKLAETDSAWHMARTGIVMYNPLHNRFNK